MCSRKSNLGIVKRPKNKKVIGSRWDLRTELNPYGSTKGLSLKDLPKIIMSYYCCTYIRIIGSVRIVTSYCEENGLDFYLSDCSYLNGEWKNLHGER
ncbi:hypothetical protein CDAR_91121 [Caerostris darwini]|uniref:Uncharacterized protein n=1 Tax=Caerostris darwini TaxID=1538125 RepID=A0AAV4QAJ0_9ARAC|nr:hypothetical protein CDAR_91121 [Caerostris darwini]